MRFIRPGTRAEGILAAGILATGLAAAAAPAAHAAATFYVSPGGNNSNGTSWANAWADTTSINWAAVAAGDTIMLDGGSSACATSPYDFGSSSNPGVNCGTSYSGFTVGQSSVTIERSTASGHNGTVVIDGGRNLALPYCGQATYTGTAGAATGITLGTRTGVVIDGQGRSGIIVRGFSNGADMGTGGGDTLRNLEIFDNGTFASHTWGYSTDGDGILLNGNGDTFDRMIVHDNGQDEFHSKGNAVSNNSIAIENSWMGALRAHPTYNWEPFNDLQASGADPGCTHADAIQIFEPASVITGLTLDHDILGPGINQGLYPNDSGTGTLSSSVTVTNTTFLDAVSHNIEIDHATAANPTGWSLTDDTIFATQNGMEIPLGTSSGTGTATGVIKQGGTVLATSGTWANSGNVWWRGGALPGSGNTNASPGFTAAPGTADPSLATLMSSASTNLTPNSCAGCAGSPLHTWQSVFDRIDTLNGAAPQVPAVVTNAATSVTGSAATLNGTVNPEGQAATYQFDYGTTTGYGTSVPSPAGSTGSGSTAVAETARLTGLTASTVYHYRIEAANATGTTFGADQQFTTGSGTCTIAENASSPAAVHTGFGVASGTTASFSPPAASLVEMQVNTLQGAAGGVTTSVKDSLNNAYTAGPSKEGTGTPGGVFFYQHYYTTAPGSVTETASQSGANKGTMQIVVKVLTGANPSQAGAATATKDGTTITTSQSLSITTTTAGSRVYVSAANGDAASSVLTAQAGTASIDVWRDTTHSGDVGATGKSASATGTPGAATFGWTANVSDKYVAGAQEILPATGC